LGVRGQWPAGLIEQAELGLRLHARGVNLVEGEVDGYVIGPFGAVTIRVVRDVPGAASNLERARFDELAVGDILGARVALDVEKMTPVAATATMAEAEWEWSASGAAHTGFAMAAGCKRWSGGRRRGFWCCGNRRRLGGDERTRRAKQKKRRWARMGWASQATPFVYREKVQFTTLDVPAKSEFPPWTPEVRSAALVD
jgi:hypothetical protein